jgi:predicted dithiol-disulfide oxidoreductase (DUF899 family)
MLLDWEGCVNGRDVGGLPTSAGPPIRYGALLRSDSHSRLTAGGVAAVRAARISRILDLRWTRETAEEPSPFAADPVYRNVPLIAELAEQGTTMPDAYRSMLDTNQRQVTDVFVQITQAPPGPIGVHCSAGRDRTGVLVALALSVAGVPPASIAEDYALTDGCSGDTILRTLAHLDDRHGGVEAYLLKGGASHAQLRQVRNRLLPWKLRTDAMTSAPGRGLHREMGNRSEPGRRHMTEKTATALPPVVDRQTWRAALDELRVREKAATRELDAIAAQRRRLPMVELPDYTLIGANGPVRLVDVFDGRSQLIVYNHMWSDGAEWQCGGCTGFTSQYVRLDFLDNYDARFVVVTNGPIEEVLAYKEKVGNKMEWYSSSESSFGADVDAPPGAGFAVNVFLRDGDTVYRTWHTNGRGTEQLSHAFPLIDLLPWGRQEEWQDSPAGWPKSPTYSNWLDSPDIARLYGPGGESA